MRRFLNGFRIGRIRGIPIRVDLSFLIVLPFLAFLFGHHFVTWANLADVSAARVSGSPFLWGLGVALGLFLSVLVHELAHSLYALRHGGKVEDITLLMIGGVSRMSEPPRGARHQGVMALAGPVTSLALGVGFFGLHLLAPAASAPNLRFAFFCLAQLNVVLGVFNLLPAFPMDGGRILRALLVKRLGQVGATQAAARVGVGFAAVFAVLGIVSMNFILLLVAYFVYIGARAESNQEVAHAALAGIRVDEVMTGSPAPLDGNMRVGDAADRMATERVLQLPVTEDGVVRGMLTLQRVQQVAPERRHQVQVSEVMKAVRPLAPDDDAWTAFRALEGAQVEALPVATGEALVGIVTREDFVRTLQLRRLRAMGAARGRWEGTRREEAHP